MKKLLLSIPALTLFAGSSLFAQSLAGTWQGILQVPQTPGGQLRTVIQISKNGSDAPSATLYSIDRGGQPVSANAVSQQGTTVKISIAAVGDAFEGRLSPNTVHLKHFDAILFEGECLQPEVFA